VNGYISPDRFGYRVTNKVILVGNPQKDFYSETTFLIHNSHYCYMKENEDLEQWHLHLHPLE